MKLGNKAGLISSRNFDHSFYESEWNRLIKPCYLKLVKTDQQYQQISKIAKKIGKKKKSDHCRKRFDKKSDLKIHERSCNGNKPYSCQTCSECFQKISNCETKKIIKNIFDSQHQFRRSKINIHISNILSLMSTHHPQIPQRSDLCLLLCSSSVKTEYEKNIRGKLIGKSSHEFEFCLIEPRVRIESRI